MGNVMKTEVHLIEKYLKGIVGYSKEALA